MLDPNRTPPYKIRDAIGCILFESPFQTTLLRCLQRTPPTTYGIIRAVTILKRVMAAKPFAKKTRGGLPGRAAAPFPRASPRANGPALPPALWLRNPQSAIRNPQSVSGIRNPYQKSVSYFFLQGGCRAFLWQGLFAIRKIRTSVNPYLKSVIRIMNP